MSAQALIDELAQGGLTLDVIGQKKHAIIESGIEAVEPLLHALEGRGLSADAVTNMLRDTLRRLSADAQDGVAHALERRLEPGVDAPIRRTVMRLMEEGFCLSTHSGEPLFKIAADRSQPVALRCQAMTTLAVAPMRRGSDERLLGLLADPDADVVLAVLGALERQAAHVDPDRAQRALWHAALSREAAVRRRAIALLGTFGEIDVVERVCLLPTPEAADIQAVQEMIQSLLQRPRNVYRLNPSNFEHMIHQLLLKMGFEGVERVGGPGDGGVDVRAHRYEDAMGGGHKERRQYVVQCKRHAAPIGPEEVLRFIGETLSQQPEAHGLFVTTTTFTPAAREARGSHRLQLVGREELQQHLDKYLGSGVYCIRA